AQRWLKVRTIVTPGVFATDRLWREARRDETDLRLSWLMRLAQQTFKILVLFRSVATVIGADMGNPALA